MPCYRFEYKCSSMKPDFIGHSIKHAHSEEEALKYLAKGGTAYNKKTKTLIDSKRNIITILEITII